MSRNHLLAWLVASAMLALFSSCSDTESPNNSLSFSIADRCKQDVLYKMAVTSELSSLEFNGNFEDVDIYASHAEIEDTVYFKKNSDGSASATISFATYCGLDFTLKVAMDHDTLFIDDVYDSDVYPSCSCVAEVNVTIPAEYTSAKILVPGGSRYYTRMIVFKE